MEEKEETAVHCDVYESPIGALWLTSDGKALTKIVMNREVPKDVASDPILERAKQWLDDYFRGQPRNVDFPLAPEGTAFQKMVWQLLLDIPWGAVSTYGDLARDMARLLGKEKMSAQAIGQAVGANPIAILIPCHRVVGAKGKLTGYAYGLDKKIWLLDHERNDCV